MVLELNEMKNNIDKDDLISMMLSNENINTFKTLFKNDHDFKKWSELLNTRYLERSYESVGGDEGYLENPSINTKRLHYLEELISFLENSGIEAENNAPQHFCN